MQLGKIGVWRRHDDSSADIAQEIEALGYSALWLGRSPSLAQARPFLERTTTIAVATGILNVWRNEPADVATEHAELTRAFPGRFLLGLGIGHPEAISEYANPLAKMTTFLDGLDAGSPPVPRDERIMAALGPKMLDLAAERTLGSFPYFVTPEHTKIARERVGPDKLVVVELAVVVDTEAETARATAREYAALYLGASNYVRNLKRLGFTHGDIGDGGSDRLIDAVIPHGSPEEVAEGVRAHLDAGADHVCVQPLGDPEPVDDYRALARVLVA